MHPRLRPWGEGARWAPVVRTARYRDRPSSPTPFLLVSGILVLQTVPGQDRMPSCIAISFTLVCKCTLRRSTDKKKGGENWNSFPQLLQTTQLPGKTAALEIPLGGGGHCSWYRQQPWMLLILLKLNREYPLLQMESFFNSGRDPPWCQPNFHPGQSELEYTN